MKHAYLHHLGRPCLEIQLPGHKVTGSRRPLIETTYRELDTKNNQFIYKDGRGAYVDYSKRNRHGCMMVDGGSVKNAQFRMHIFDQSEKLKSAELPERFPFTLGGELGFGASVEIDGKSISFRFTKLSSKSVSR